MPVVPTLRSQGHSTTVFVLLFLLYMFDYIDREIVAGMFPVMKADLHMTDSQLGLLISAIYASIVVLANNYFATPYPRGSDQISGLPAGRYKLRAWHESLPPIETWANLDDATLRSVDLKFKP